MEADALSLRPDDAARALIARGSVREAIALLRGAVARDPGNRDWARALEHALGGQRPETEGTVELGLHSVDEWIRHGMLVEALALLGGTEMGSRETGGEWANLLGELLAPVPAHAEATLVAMHDHLLTGGASLALVLLGEREERGPALPAWARRRLELLRWMLLDNASIAERSDPVASEGGGELADRLVAARATRQLTLVAEATQAFLETRPADPDGLRVLKALELLEEEAERHLAADPMQMRTLPTLGLAAVAMQLRMANFEYAARLYERLVTETPDDPLAALLLAETQVVLRAAAGEPVAEDGFDGEATRASASPRESPEAHASFEGSELEDDAFEDETTQLSVVEHAVGAERPRAFVRGNVRVCPTRRVGRRR